MIALPHAHIDHHGGAGAAVALPRRRDAVQHRDDRPVHVNSVRVQERRLAGAGARNPVQSVPVSFEFRLRGVPSTRAHRRRAVALLPEQLVAAISPAGRLYRHVEERAEGGGPEAIDVAFDQQFERRFGVGRWTLAHLKKGRAKTCDVSVFARMRAAYIAICERQMAKLQHEIAVEKATHDDDDLRDLEAAAAALAAKIAARKAALK